MSEQKKIVYLFSDGMDYKNIVFEDLSGITGWIESDIDYLNSLSDDDLKDVEYTIRVTRMTQDEIDNLPEGE